MTTTRRDFLRVLGGAAAVAGSQLDVAPAFAQSTPVKVGILTIKDLILYRRQREVLVERVVSVPLPIPASFLYWLQFS